jgi:hypothetical protein
MLNLFVETKNEYMTHLINILSPLIFEGIQSIYKDAQKTSKERGKDIEILQIFQTFLKRIPVWNQNIIDKETERIMTCSHSYEWLENLIKATLKSNLVILMYNPTIKSQVKLDKSYYTNISLSDFIHKTYIECARELWNNPYLFYHCYPPIEIKRNQRDCILLIKDCIKETIRKLLPVKHLLNVYLGEDDETYTKSIADSDVSKFTEEKQLEYNHEDSDSRTVGSKILDIIGDECKENECKENEKKSGLVETIKPSGQDLEQKQEQKQGPAPDLGDDATSTEKIVNKVVSSEISSMDSLKLDITSDSADDIVKDMSAKVDNQIKDILKYDEPNLSNPEVSITDKDKDAKKYLSIFSNSENKDNKPSRIFKNFRDF